MASVGTLALAPLYTASTWPTLVQSTARAAAKKNGLDGAMPRLSNRDALALIFAWHRAARRLVGAWPLWYQYAAIALGWEEAGDALQVGDERARELYAADYLPSLWASLADLSTAMHDAQVDKPELAVIDVWDEPGIIGDVNRALADDGVSAQLKVPVITCKDPKTGKRVPPKLKCEQDAKKRVNKCYLVCEDPQLAEDPITRALKRYGKLALAAGAIYLVLGAMERRRKPTSRRRSRYGNASRSRALLA